MTQEQITLMDYDKRRGEFNHVRAQAVKWIREFPGITCPQLKIMFADKWKYVPEVQNRLREAENKPLEWIVSRKEADGLLHYFPKEGAEFERPHIC